MLKRILMSAVDETGGSGNGAPPAGTPAPAPTPTPQAQGDAPITLDTIRQVVRDAINADARREGAAQKKLQPKGENAPAFDPARYRELDRAVTRAGMAETLSSTAYKRLEKAFADESPDDAEAWVADYFTGMGVAKKSTTAPAPTTTPAQLAPVKTPNQPPASDRGAPPAPQSPVEEPDLLKLSIADRDALIRSKGNGWYRDTLLKQLARVTVKAR
jgi:hypothetical protein